MFGKYRTENVGRSVVSNTIERKEAYGSRTDSVYYCIRRGHPSSIASTGEARAPVCFAYMWSDTSNDTRIESAVAATAVKRFSVRF